MVNKRKVVFRADGSSAIGMGHFTRTLALAEMLNQHFYCIYATRKPSEYQISEIQKICHDIIDLPEDDTHFEFFLEHLNGTEIVVLDNYYFTTDYQRKIKTKGCKLVCIDDMHDKHYVADVVINHAIKNENNFSIEKYTKLFLGLEYALIRKSFFNQYGLNRESDSILLNLGGSDFNNITTKILDYLVEEKIHYAYKIIVLIGNSNRYQNEIEKFCAANNICVDKNLNDFQLSRKFERICYAILPASTILIEALYKKVNIMGGYYVKNQEEFYSYLKFKQCIYPIDDLKITSNYNKIKDGLSNMNLKSCIKNRRHINLINYIVNL